jgi:hypothetical protein
VARRSTPRELLTAGPRSFRTAYCRCMCAGQQVWRKFAYELLIRLSSRAFTTDSAVDESCCLPRPCKQIRRHRARPRHQPPLLSDDERRHHRRERAWSRIDFHDPAVQSCRSFRRWLPIRLAPIAMHLANPRPRSVPPCNKDFTVTIVLLNPPASCDCRCRAPMLCYAVLVSFG